MLQITTDETILNKLEEKIETHVDPNGFWSVDGEKENDENRHFSSFFFSFVRLELVFALENVDETARRILSPTDEHQQRNSFDFNWFTNEIDV